NASQRMTKMRRAATAAAHGCMVRIRPRCISSAHLRVDFLAASRARCASIRRAPCRGIGTPRPVSDPARPASGRSLERCSRPAPRAMDSSGTAGYIGSHSGHGTCSRGPTPGEGDAMLSEARADHRACAPGNLHRMLLDVSHATASHRDLKSLLCELAGLLRRVARFDRLAIVLHDPERDVMRLHTIVSLEPTFTTDLELPVPESPAGLVWQTQRPLVVPRIDRETRFAEVRRILRAEGMRSFCVLPLTTPLRRLGGLSFASQDEDAFSDSDVEVPPEPTAQAALAVDNTLHHEAADRAQQELASERDRLRLLLEVNNALVSNLE